MLKVFVSYSSIDRNWVAKLVTALENYDLEIWWDTKIRAGQLYSKIIEDALDSADCVIVIWTENSIKSEWVLAEANEAFKRKVLIPVIYENVRIPIPFTRLENVDLANWKGTVEDKKFQKLVSGIFLHSDIPDRDKEEETLSAKKTKKIEEHKDKVELIDGKLKNNPESFFALGLKRFKNFFSGSTIIREKENVVWMPTMAQVESLYSFLKNYADYNAFFLAPNIPEKKLDNSISAFGVPAEESVLALIDCTILGTSENGLIFGKKGIYGHNNWTTSRPGKFHLEYQALICNRIHEGNSSYEVNLGSGLVFNCSGGLNTKRVIEILRGICSLVKSRV